MRGRTRAYLTVAAATMLSLLPAGCLLSPAAKPAGVPSVTSRVDAAAANLGTATDELGLKSEEVNVKETVRDSKILADANAAQKANQSNPEGVPREQVDSHLVVLKGRLGGASEDPVEAAAAAERDRLFEMGRSAEARAATDAAQKEAQQQSSELAVAKEELKNVRLRLGEEITNLHKELSGLRTTLAANQAANQAAINSALDSARRELNRKIVIVLMVGCVLMIAAGAFLGYSKFSAGDPMKALIIAACFGGGGASCALLAYLINEPWFQRFLKISVIGVAVAGVVAIGVYLYIEFRSAKEKKLLALSHSKLDAEATEAESTLLKMYDVIDVLPDKDALLAKLSTKMDSSDKALINELKALRQRKQASAATSPLLVPST